MADDGLAARVEMLLVLRWLDDGRPDDGAVALDLASDLDQLGLDDGRQGTMTLLAALGDLEDAGKLTVRWPAAVGQAATLTLSRDLQRESTRLFGRD